MMITTKPKLKSYLKEYKTRSVVDFLKERENPDFNNDHMHEILGPKIRPVFDFDYKVDTADNFENKNELILKAAHAQICESFPKKKFPKAVIMSFVSSGPARLKKTVDGKQVFYDGFKISAHFHVRGAGKWPVEKVKAVAERLDTLKEYWDKGIYSEGKSVRMPYCTKEGENRHSQRAEINAHHVKLFSELDAYKYFKESYEDWLLVSDEPEYGVAKQDEKEKEKEKPRKGHDDDDDDDDEDEDVDEADKDWSKWTFERAKAVIERLDDDRADTHDKRISGICSIIHLARATKKIRKFRELAHLFAKKDPDYDENHTDDDWDYCKARKVQAGKKPRTFASLIKFANEDNPVAKAIKLVEIEDIPLTNYDEKYKLIADKATLVDVQKWMLGCIRYCDREGQERWFQHSTDGWYQIQNMKNLPFGSGSSNSKFQDTTFLDILLELKDTEAFHKHCRIDGTVFWPFYDEPERTDIINTFNGWPFKASGKKDLTENAKFFRDYILGLFDKVPGEYVLNTLTKKLRFPRWRGALIVGLGRFGGEGKNATEALITGIFGKQHVLSCAGTKHILGQGDAEYNPLIEDKLLVFSQEAKSEGKSIVDDEKFKSWLSEDTQVLRKMKENPRVIANMAICFIWTNNLNCLKMKGPMARRTMAQRISDQYMDDKELFDEVWSVSKDPEALQEIFDWLVNRDISNFVSENIPETELKNDMKEESMTPIQRYVTELCNNTLGIDADVHGNVTYPVDKLYQNFRSFCQNEGMTKIMQAMTFKSELKNMDIEIKQARYEGTRPICAVIDGPELEKIMRKFLKNKEWKLLRPKDEEDEEDDNE